MPEAISIGPFLVQTSWLIVAGAGLVSYFIIVWMAKRSTSQAKQIADIYFNGVLIVAITWKFGSLLFNPSIIIDSPLNLIYVMGTQKHVWLGIAIASLYAYWQTKRKQISFKSFLDLFPFGFLPFLFFSQLLIAQYGMQTDLPWGISLSDPEISYHPINLYSALIALVIFSLLWKKRKEIGSGHCFTSFLLFYGIGKLIVSYFQQPDLFIIGLTRDQLIYFGYIIFSRLFGLTISKEVT